MRRLASGLAMTAVAVALAGGSTRATASGSDDSTPAATAAASTANDADETGRVRVLQVSGLFDPIVVASIEDAIDAAGADGSQALVLQVNSRGAVVGDDRMEQLLAAVADSPVAVAVWVGPSGARLYGAPAQLLAVADVTGMAPGARVGRVGELLQPDGVTVDFGEATTRLRAGSVGLRDARELGVFNQRIPDEGVATLKSMIDALNGYRHDGVTLRTTQETVDDDGVVQRETTATVVLSKLDLIDQIFHSVASPPVAYLLLLIGLALLIFEFFTAGVGIAGVVGAGSLVLACTGLAALPARGWAVGIIVVSMVAYAVDVQVGIPRLWTGVGAVGTLIGSVLLFESVAGSSLRPSWITLIAGVGGTLLTFVVGMPSMVRTRFATPTIGRDWMIGQLGAVIESVDPDGVVEVGAARWRARTNRATPVAAGDRVRVVAIDGVTLEVEPLEGAARDHRERRSTTATSPEGGSAVPEG
ncbi:nodulation protein NfeD [soil metagenome]